MSKPDRGKGYKAYVRELTEGPARVLDKVTFGKVSPNMVSVGTLMLHVPVAWLLANCYLGSGGLFLLLVAPLDLLDGALARVQNKTSNFGTVLDAVLDRVKEIMIFGAIGYHLASNGSREDITLLAVTIGLAVLVSYVRAKGEMAVNAASSKRKSAAGINRAFEFGLMGYETRVAVLGLGLIFDQLIPALWVIAMGAAITACMRLESTRRRLKA